MALFTNIVVALPSEARPLISELSLRPEAMAHGIKLYVRADFRLLISGIGKIASASAVGVLAGMSKARERQIWLNVGIAGHATLPVGDIAIAHSVTEVASGKVLYPSIAFPPSIPSVALHCFDEPTSNYPPDTLCDMESAGFYAAAARFADAEFIQLVKVVSDNREAHLSGLDRGKISGLVHKNIDQIITLIDQLTQLDRDHRQGPNPLPIEPLLAQWRFSVTQQAQLRELSRRWGLLIEDRPWPPAAELMGCTSGREVLVRLGDFLDTQNVRLTQVRRHD